MNPIMKSLCQFCLLVVLMLSSLSLVAQEGIDPGQAYFNRGNFEKAVKYWDKALSNLLLPPKKDIKSCIDTKKCIDTSVRLAAAYQALGQVNRALKVLKPVLPLVEDDDPKRRASVLLQLSHVYLAMRDFQDRDMTCGMKKEITHRRPVTRKEIMSKALYYIQQAENTIILVDSQKNRYPVLWANILNSKGNVLMALKGYADAESAYQESVELADRGGDKLLSAKASVNLIEAMVQSGDYKQVKDKPIHKKTLQLLKELPDSHDKAFALIGFAQFMQKWQSSSTDTPPFSSEKILQEAIKVAKGKKDDFSDDDNITMAYAESYLAEHYTREKNDSQAIQYIRQAIFTPKFIQSFIIIQNCYPVYSGS